MAETPLKILTNVFICTSGNDLQLVEIHFRDRIEQVLPRISFTIPWHDVDEKGKVYAIHNQLPNRQLDAHAQIIDANFLLLIPGAIDAHVHFNTPGFEHRDDFVHGSLAAAAGGVTTVIDMPCTSLPPVTTVANLTTKLGAIVQNSLVDFALWGGIAGNDLADSNVAQAQVFELADAGVAGFKAYLISGMDTFGDVTVRQMWQIAEWVRLTGRPLAVHAEDKTYITVRESLLREAGRNDWRAYCEARSVAAEAKAVADMVRIARATDCAVHIVHLSSKTALELIRVAQQDGVPISAETCPHYLYFTQDDFQNPDIANYLKTAPPVKHAVDREALWEGLNDGSLLFVSTDHAGCNPAEEKTTNNFWNVYGGIPGVEHRVPFMLSEGFLGKRLSLFRTIELLSTNVAAYFNLSHRKGTIVPGKDADFALVDLWDEQIVRARQMHCKGKYTPFEGAVWKAVVHTTFVRGKIVFSRQYEVEARPGDGRPLGLNLTEQ